MQYPNIHSRAGLVVLIFALNFSLVSTAPIPLVISLASTTIIPDLSSRSDPILNGEPLINGRTSRSTLPQAPATRLIFAVRSN